MYYNMYVVKSFEEQDFLEHLRDIVLLYIVAVIGRSLFFVLANLAETKRLVNRVLRNICF
jgi:hypothetical protein